MGKTQEDLENSRKKREFVIEQFGEVPTSIWPVDYSWGKSTLELDERKQQKIAEEKHKKMKYNLQTFETQNGEVVEFNQIQDAFSMSSQNVRGKGAGLSTFPPDLCRKITVFYSNEGDTILDPCCGHASRLETVHKLNRHYIGYDVCHAFCVFNEKVKEKLLSDQLFPSQYTITLREQSSEKMVEKDASIDLVFTSPPYHDIEFYDDNPAQLGYKKTYEEFLAGITRVLSECYRVLKPNKFCVFNVNDFRKDNKYYIYHADIARIMEQVGFKLWDIVIIPWKSCIGQCLTSNTEILTNKGYKQIQDIKVNDLVISHLGKQRKVQHIFARLIKEKVYELSIAGTNDKIILTKEHPILSVKKSAIMCVRNKHLPCNGHFNKSPCVAIKGVYKTDCNKNNDKLIKDATKWNNVSSLLVGDYVAIQTNLDVKDIESLDICDFLEKERFYIYNNKYILPKLYKPSSVKINRNIDLDYDLMKLFGYFLSEGHIYVYKKTGYAESITFTFNKKEKNYIKDVITIMHNKFNLKGNIYEPKQYKTASITFYSRTVSEFFLRLFGNGFNKKVIPDAFLSLPTQKQLGLLCGLFRGDGCLLYNQKKEISSMNLGMSNKNIIKNTREILLRLGYVFAYGYYKPKISKNLTYRISISAKKAPALIAHIFNKKIIGGGLYTLSTPKSNTYNFRRIVNIRQLPFEGNVYNLEVAIDNSYIAEGIICHNCFAGQVWDRKITAKSHEYLVVGKKI